MSDLSERELAAMRRQFERDEAEARSRPACPVCGFRGDAVKTGANNGVVTACLAVLTILLGWFVSWLLGVGMFLVMVMYVAFTSGEVWRCGRCGAKKADA